MRKKLAIGGICCLTILVIAASISRIAVIQGVLPSQPADITWYIMSSAIEAAVGKILVNSQIRFSEP